MSDVPGDAGAAPRLCEWLTLQNALGTFVLNASGHQGQDHIRALHHYVACRLVVEGGFRPSEITPHPPFRVIERGRKKILEFHAASAGSGERTVLGGIKTKSVDVVVTKPTIGPVIAISMKGTLGAFRNLTNRMEEAIGDCTNLHISYPTLVYGFLHVLRATRQAPGVARNDVCVSTDGSVVDSISRYHDVLARLEGRQDIRDEKSKYEAVALVLAEPGQPAPGSVLANFPAAGSPLLLSEFFEKVYKAYDLRFVYAAPALEPQTERWAWDPASPALSDARSADYAARVADQP